MSNNITCTRKFEFDTAHRVIGHEGKCKYLHGHRYVLEVTFIAAALNELGMVIDFGIVKSIIKEWIDNNFDHTAILSSADKALGEELTNVTGQTVYYLPYNPTAENISQYLFTEILPSLFKDSSISIKSIKLYETPNCFVELISL